MVIGCSKKDYSALKDADVDLAKLSSTMVYAEINNILTSLDEYIGKTIRISGVHNDIYYDNIDRSYHYIAIED